MWDLTTKPRSHEIVAENPIRVQRKRTKGYRLPANTVSVTRPGKWGNPFKVGQARIDTPVRAVDAFRQFMNDLKCAAMRAEARKELRGKNLACYCALDKVCHADVLLEIANSDEPSGGGA